MASAAAADASLDAMPIARREQALGYPYPATSSCSTSNLCTAVADTGRGKDQLAFSLPSFTAQGLAEIATAPLDRQSVRKLKTPLPPQAQREREPEPEQDKWERKAREASPRLETNGADDGRRDTVSTTTTTTITPPASSPPPSSPCQAFTTWLPDDSLQFINPRLLSESERVTLGERSRSRTRGEDNGQTPTTHVRGRPASPSGRSRKRSSDDAQHPADTGQSRPTRPTLRYRPSTTDFDLLRQVKSNNLTLPATPLAQRPSASGLKAAGPGPQAFRQLPAASRPLPSPFTTKPLIRNHPYPYSATRYAPARPPRATSVGLSAQPSARKVHPPPFPPEPAAQPPFARTATATARDVAAPATWSRRKSPAGVWSHPYGYTRRASGGQDRLAR